MTTPVPMPCPDCGEVPSLWGDADPLRLLGIPVRPYLYIACDCGATGPARRSRHAAVRAWNEGVTMLRCEDAKAKAARLLPERDEALADALRQLERIATAVAGDEPTEAPSRHQDPHDQR